MPSARALACDIFAVFKYTGLSSSDSYAHILDDSLLWDAQVTCLLEAVKHEHAHLNTADTSADTSKRCGALLQMQMKVRERAR